MPTAQAAARPPARRTSARARPLPPDERRAALVAATLPLIVAHGTAVTTRQIAQASGVAEGTLFRVFPDKEALIRATVDAAMDPAPLFAELAQVDPTMPLRPRLIEVTSIVQRRLMRIISLLIAVGMQQPPGDVQRRRPTNRQINLALARLLKPDSDQFRCSPAEVARLLRLLIFSGSHPLITDGSPLSAEQIVALLLDGVLRRDSHDIGGRRC